ncbi:MAG: response regulator [Ignavibacteriales bacterium]|jgi:two-component system, NarL family, invasion response regulator UvrY|nr:response regulator [Ignavibacteriales bacterium]
MIKIFIADDHLLIREGLKKILRSEKDIQIVGESEDPFEVTEFVRDNELDILILDISLPGKSGLDVLKEVKAMKPDLHVLILSMHPEERFATRALKSGAAGYITKESASEELMIAIRKVSTHGKYISPSLAEKIALSLDPTSDKLPHETLSDREYQVLRHMASGKTQSEIAEELFLSISTINTYRSRILEKLNLKSNIELIHYAITNNLVD